MAGTSAKGGKKVPDSKEIKRPSKKERSWLARNPKLVAALCAAVVVCIAVVYSHDSVGRPEYVPIDRVPMSEMTAERFLQEYAERKPVAISGAWSTPGWLPKEIAATCPQARIRTHRFDKSSRKWAGHETVDAKVDLQDFVASSYSEDNAKRPDPVLYGFEFELTKHCPEMLEKVLMPGYLAGDAFHLVTNGTGIGWPSVLLGPSGSETGLHIDTHRTPFWIAVAGEAGKTLKRWRVFPHDDAQLLKYGSKGDNTNIAFDFDPWAPDARLTGHRIYEGDLVAGDILYVPGGSPHCAQNVNDNAAISLNYLDLKALPSFAKKCTPNSPLCGLVAGKGKWIMDVLGERQSQQEPMTYFEFSGLADRAEFCAAHEKTTLDDKTRPPALETYCSQA